MILFSLLDALQGPLWVSVQATGKIRNYQILMSVIILANLPISYLFLRMGYVPEVVLTIRCLLNFLILFIRLWYLRRLYGFPVCRYLQEVVGRVIMVTTVVYPIVYLPLGTMGFVWKIILLGIISFLMDGWAMYYLGLDYKERKLLMTQLKKIYEKCK